MRWTAGVTNYFLTNSSWDSKSLSQNPIIQWQLTKWEEMWIRSRWSGRAYGEDREEERVSKEWKECVGEEKNREFMLGLGYIRPTWVMWDFLMQWGEQCSVCWEHVHKVCPLISCLTGTESGRTLDSPKEQRRFYTVHNDPSHFFAHQGKDNNTMAAHTKAGENT